LLFERRPGRGEQQGEFRYEALSRHKEHALNSVRLQRVKPELVNEVIIAVVNDVGLSSSDCCQQHPACHFTVRRSPLHRFFPARTPGDRGCRAHRLRGHFGHVDGLFASLG
jgi:hypothetical protein